MNRPWHTWLAFGFCLIVVFVAMGWVSLTVIRLDHADAMAQANAKRQEAIRLALWRADSALSPLVTHIAGLPYFVYKPFYPANRAYTRMFNRVTADEILLPSPLLTMENEYVLLYFQCDQEGDVYSPQVPSGDMRVMALQSHTTEERIERSSLLLDDLRGFFEFDQVHAALPANGGPAIGNVSSVRFTGLGNSQELLFPDNSRQAQIDLNSNEQQARGQQFQQALISNSARNSLDYELPKDVTTGTLTPHWVGDALLLAQRVSVGSDQYVQGCWLDWTAIESWLKKEVADLLPDASFEPVLLEPSDEDYTMLAALPVKLDPGKIPVRSRSFAYPIRLSLYIAWGFAIFAVIAVAALLAGTLSLSERRAAFVSAVTHEMRTPLTTLRMYTDMLVKGMVPNEEKRGKYLTTLRREALRLGHLVENVLAYSRLEKVNEAERLESMPLSQVLSRMENRLAERAAQEGLELVVNPLGKLTTRRVVLDISTVEQILFNLVDNACKYAAQGAVPQIHLEFVEEADKALISVRDHGPGILEQDRRNLFKPFRKSAHRAAVTAPGVGLGLALSRRLARQIGGDLYLGKTSTTGCTFVLSLKYAK